MRNFETPGRSRVFSYGGMCATSHPIAVATALEIMKKGGNAVDAGIAAALVLGIAEPQSTGIGGDCFALIAKPGKPVIGLNGSGRAAAGADPERLRAEGHSAVPLYTPDAVTIPTAIAGFCKLSEDHGKLGLDTVLAPAIHYARNGLPIAPRVAYDYAESADILQGIAKTVYANVGKPLQTGDHFATPAQADALERVAEHGWEGFYTGSVAEDMAKSLQALGGCHTLEDFAAAQANETTPISSTYKGYELIEHPPNGQGLTAQIMLEILARFDLPSLDPAGAMRAHLEAEAAKLAYSARDEFINEQTDAELAAYLLSKPVIESLVDRIQLDGVLPVPVPPPSAPHRDTVYLSVVDETGLAISLIYSIFHSFGSGIASDRYHILFQNRGAGFNLIPGHANEYGPGKRPLHTIIPGMLRHPDGALTSFGVMGGAYQPCGHARFVTNLVDFGMDAQTAIDMPRSFPENGRLRIESVYSEHVKAKLRDFGHVLAEDEGPLGGAQAITITPNGMRIGASDPRKDGAAMGF